VHETGAQIANGRHGHNGADSRGGECHRRMFFSWFWPLRFRRAHRATTTARQLLMQWMLADMFQFIFGAVGFIVVAWFSRWREFRADAGGARYAGRDHMISALKTLELVHATGSGRPRTAAPSLPSPQNFGQNECRGVPVCDASASGRKN